MRPFYKNFTYTFETNASVITAEALVYEDEGYYCADCRAQIPGTFDFEIEEYEAEPLFPDDEECVIDYEKEMETMDVEEYIKEHLSQDFITKYNER